MVSGCGIPLTINASGGWIVAFRPWRDFKLHDGSTAVSRRDLQLKAQVAHGLHFGADTIFLRGFQFLSTRYLDQIYAPLKVYGEAYLTR